MGEKDVEKKKKKRERDDGGSKDSTPKKPKKLNKEETPQKSSAKKNSKDKKTEKTPAKTPDETITNKSARETPAKENVDKPSKKEIKAGSKGADTPKSSKKDKKRAAENGEETPKSPKSAKKEKKKKKKADSNMEEGDEDGTASAEKPSVNDDTATAPQENGIAVSWGKPKGVRPFPKLSPIAQPLADKKLKKTACKLIGKAAKSKMIKRGVKEVVKSIRKGSKGVCVLAGDIAPVDVLSHVPILCEESDIPYVYVPSKEELGHSGGTKRPTSCTLVLEKSPKGQEMDSETKELYQEVKLAMEKILKSAFT